MKKAKSKTNHQIYMTVRDSDMKRIEACFASKGIPIPYREGDMIQMACRMWADSVISEHDFLQQG